MKDPLELCEKIQLELLRCAGEIRQFIAEYQADSEILNISEAAELLGQHPQTLRRLEKTGKLVPQRRGAAAYRYYTRAQVLGYLKKIGTPGETKEQTPDSIEEETF